MRVPIAKQASCTIIQHSFSYPWRKNRKEIGASQSYARTILLLAYTPTYNKYCRNKSEPNLHTFSIDPLKVFKLVLLPETEIQRTQRPDSPLWPTIRCDKDISILQQENTKSQGYLAFPASQATWIYGKRENEEIIRLSVSFSFPLFLPQIKVRRALSFIASGALKTLKNWRGKR